MANLGKVVYLSEAQKETLFANGSVTVGGVTITYSDNDMYMTPLQIPTVPSAYTSIPLADGTASPGSSPNWARGDHVHPKDSSKLNANLGSANAGKFLVVGNDGTVTLATISSAGGVSF